MNITPYQKSADLHMLCELLFRYLALLIPTEQNINITFLEDQG
jgi:hypothetical protein